ncbi:hypothetical protein AVEN_250734-1 [Araneus ventricosus]|uniref:Uncharacterized protein n=1 Tax=Araneus ventricosus TaxID=182803 RepID=A0A4Y2DY07_ARAVE|nr:hypothetical protein AVEN_250734-1 [Araneus ventricosus]
MKWQPFRNLLCYLGTYPFLPRCYATAREARTCLLIRGLLIHAAHGVAGGNTEDNNEILVLYHILSTQRFYLCVQLNLKDYFAQTMVCYGLAIDSSTKPSSAIVFLLAGQFLCINIDKTKKNWNSFDIRHH